MSFSFPSFLEISFQFAILTFCVHQIVGQENVKTGDFVKSPRSLSDDRTINYKNNVQQQVTVADSADEFVIKKPTKTDKSYDDFLSFLYRNDKAKPKIKRQISSDSSNSNDLTRHKRIILFR